MSKPKLRVYNDHLLVELERQDFVTADETGEEKKAQKGKVVASPKHEDILYLSSYTWVAEESVLDSETLEILHDKMAALVGKTVYFEERSNIGTTITIDGVDYATIKLAKITAVED